MLMKKKERGEREGKKLDINYRGTRLPGAPRPAWVNLGVLNLPYFHKKARVNIALIEHASRAGLALKTRDCRS